MLPENESTFLTVILVINDVAHIEPEK